MIKTLFKARVRATAETRAAVSILLVLFGAPLSHSQEPLTFNAALERMRGRNEALMAGQDEVRQREAEKAVARGLRAPTAELEIRRYYLEGKIEMPLDPIPYSYKLQNSRFNKGEIQVKWPFYTGGRIDAANRAAEAKQDEAEAQLRYTGDQLVTELAQRYFGLCLARRARDVNALKVSAMEQHTRRANRLLEEGIISKAESLNAEVALSNAKSELAASDRDINIAAEGLLNSLASTNPVQPSTPLFLLHDLEAREYFENKVNEQHPVLAMIGAKRIQAHQGVRAEEGAEKPAFYMFGMHELVQHDLTFQDPKWAVGIGGQYTLYDGHQGRNKIAAAKALEERVAHQQHKMQRDLLSLTLKRYEELEKAREQYDSMNVTLVLTAENLRVRARAFEEGVTTSIEVVDATLLHARAQLGRLKAAYDFDVAFFQLLEASGQTGRNAEYLTRAIPVPENDSLPFPSDNTLVEPLDKKTVEQ